MQVPPELADTGITYRQLDYWIDKGHVRPEEPHPGSGNGRRYPAEEIEIAKRIKANLDCGYSLHAAARIAREDA